MTDADGDVIRCRWATAAQEECGGVCQTFPAMLDQVSFQLNRMNIEARYRDVLDACS